MLSAAWQHYQEGGWAMWLIMFWLVCSIAVIVERIIYLYGASINKDVFLATMQKCILAGDIAKAVKMCSAANAPLARIVQQGLLKVNRPDDEVQAAMDEAALVELPKINKLRLPRTVREPRDALRSVRHHRRSDQGVRRGRRRIRRPEPEGAHLG
jgi:biopolymer transport protein ExbB/TolQ